MLCVLNPRFPLLFKIKSDIVVCVLLLACFPSLQEGVGECVVTGSPAPGTEVPRHGMAAPWWRGVSGLFSLLRSQPAYRPLQNEVPRDVLLFQNERGRFFATLGLFCAGQGIFWTSLAVAALSRPLIRGPAEAPNQGNTDLRSALWRYGLAVGCGTMGKGMGFRLPWGCEHKTQ